MWSLVGLAIKQLRLHYQLSKSYSTFPQGMDLAVCHLLSRWEKNG